MVYSIGLTVGTRITRSRILERLLRVANTALLHCLERCQDQDSPITDDLVVRSCPVGQWRALVHCPTHWYVAQYHGCHGPPLDVVSGPRHACFLGCHSAVFRRWSARDYRTRSRRYQHDDSDSRLEQSMCKIHATASSTGPLVCSL